MRAECIDAVAQAIGRSLNQQELQQIEDRVRVALPAARKALIDAGQTPTPRAMMEAAAEIAGKALDADAALKRQRIAQTILAHDRIANYLAGTADKLDALDRLLAFKADAKGRVMSVESQGNAIAAEAIGRMTQTLEASSPRFFGMVEDANGVRLLVKEMMGEATGHKDAAAGAAAWREVTEALRLRFNAAGGDIGKLEDWGLPHHHSQPKVAQAGVKAWVEDVLPMLKRERYVNEDGALMDDGQVRAFLESAWQTIATNGINKLEPGKAGTNAMRANWGSETRQIHFKDGDSWVAYQVKYGDRGFYDIMGDHVRSLSKQIALVETFGPNPHRTFELFRDEASKAAAVADPVRAGQIDDRAVRLTNLYNFVAGRTLPVANQKMARVFDNVRSWMVASRLGSAVITSITDEATLHLTAAVNRLPEMQLLQNELATLNPANKAELRMAKRAGLAVEAMISEINRFGQEGLGASFSSKMATATIRASGLSAITAARKRAFSVTMMDSIGHLAGKKRFADLDASDHRILLSKGVTETDWAVWKLAKPEDWDGRNTTMLTPESIRAIPDAALQRLANAEKTTAQALRDRATTRLLGAVLEETDMAVITPGMRERAFMGAGLQRGTLKGELTRSFFLFKSFPLAMIERHFMRGMGQKTAGGKAVYLASLVASTTLLGAVAQQISEVIGGRDPKNMNLFDDPAKAAKFWAQAFFKGGSLGIYGDFIYSEATHQGTSGLAAMLGPVAGAAEDMIGLTQGNLIQWAQGKDTHFGAELVRNIKSNTPGASLWYAKAALDHLFFQQLQEMMSPGYLRSMQTRARREFDQEFWWELGQAAPSRAPNLGAAVGE